MTVSRIIGSLSIFALVVLVALFNPSCEVYNNIGLTEGTWTIQLNGDAGRGMEYWVTWDKIYFQGSETGGILGQEGTDINGTYDVEGKDIEISIEIPSTDQSFDLNGSFLKSFQMGGTWATPSPGFELIESKQWTGTWNKDG